MELGMTDQLPPKLSGLIPMNDWDYALAKGVRKSQLDLLAISPATAKTGFKEQTEAMIIGSLVHCLVLQPELFDLTYAVAPACDMRTKAGKEEYQTFIEGVEHLGIQVIKQEDYEKARNMRDNALNVIGDFLEMPDAIIENAAFWTDSETGIACKCKPDIYVPSLGLAIDLKTTGGYATADDFGKSVKSYRYHVQQAFYTQGLNANGFDVNHFLFAPVSKSAGNTCRAFSLDSRVVALGHKLLKDDLTLWADCEQANNWSRKPSQIETIHFKPWEYPQDDNE
jgi:exodeoxyribonuclease VIII